ncbi:MAG: DNA translocase FtsK [Candidatus Ryanbacteria bacterium]|nr:DNA translocase FtsK [Candidatus Ryanbacteria bacterium]
MEERYKILESSKCRDVASYNARGDDFVPYIVIIIDELADLMTSFGRDAETSIVRIAQMARAVGIHLVLSTQRPSVEVITGLIKANITSRVAFQVASQIDSRTILDMAGAEKLLGSGDMLYLAGDVSKPKRIQGGFVSENEVKKVSEFVRSQEAELEYNADIVQTRGNDLVQSRFGGDDERDELYEDAYRVVQEAGKASASFLQRRLKVGYARAARLLDILEERGVIGPGEGAKPREVFGKKSEIENGGIF